MASADVISTPTKLSTRTTSKTPKGADRFIPSRAELDLEVSHFNLTKENVCFSGSEMSPSKAEYRSTLADSLFDGKVSQASKILTFKSKAPVPKSSHSNSLKVLYSQSAKESSQAPRRAHRHIPQAPERVLDAPDLIDDYYLNLLDWSSQNTVAIALRKSIYLWNAGSGEISHLMELPDADDCVTSLSWMANGSHLAVGTNHCAVQLWDVERGRRMRDMKGHTGRVGALAWNGAMLSSGSRDTHIFNHDVRAAQHLVSSLEHHTQEVCGLKWSHDGSQLASGGNDNQLNIWNVDSQDQSAPAFSLTDHTAAVRALAWCPWQQNLLASGGGTADRTIRFWNTTTGACLNSIDTKSQVCSLQWSPHYKELVSSHGFSLNQLCVWKYPTMGKVAELTGHTARVLHTAMSPDGETVVSAASDETLRFWKVFERENKATSSSRKKEGEGMATRMSSLIR
eukprot:TRINITY_DN22254_c0_g1_i1.p1 TRINITY_DN22254_c0_g1~~TRINITY_DN22254_c0_g1_i1.p1  ORF type:complete len:487 (+),score=123.40 TRINITY_DN22254_c0_g1_i1:102-1463(+)